MVLRPCWPGMTRGRRVAGYTNADQYILGFVAKHLVDLDEEMLNAARAELGTKTIKDTVNEALRRATLERQRRTTEALDVLANALLGDRADAWR